MHTQKIAAIIFFMLNPRFLPNYSSDSKSRDSTALLPEELPLPEEELPDDALPEELLPEDFPEDELLPEDEPPDDRLPLPEDEPLSEDELPDEDDEPLFP